VCVRSNMNLDVLSRQRNEISAAAVPIEAHHCHCCCCPVNPDWTNNNFAKVAPVSFKPIGAKDVCARFRAVPILQGRLRGGWVTAQGPTSTLCVILIVSLISQPTKYNLTKCKYAIWINSLIYLFTLIMYLNKTICTYNFVYKNV
jgi:hypothetical protein